jgi:hypothetical protein
MRYGRRDRARVLGVFVLLALLIGLAPLAYASPPDQTWLAGLYDNADYDDVVIALTSTIAASDGTPAPDLRPTAEVVVTLRPAEPSPPEPATRSPYHLRAPPLV